MPLLIWDAVINSFRLFTFQSRRLQPSSSGDLLLKISWQVYQLRNYMPHCSRHYHAEVLNSFFALFSTQTRNQTPNYSFCQTGHMQLFFVALIPLFHAFILSPHLPGDRANLQIDRFTFRIAVLDCIQY